MIFPIPKFMRPRATFSIYEPAATRLFRRYSMPHLMMSRRLKKNWKLQTRRGKNT